MSKGLSIIGGASMSRLLSACICLHDAPLGEVIVVSFVHTLTSIAILTPHGFGFVTLFFHMSYGSNAFLRTHVIGHLRCLHLFINWGLCPLRQVRALLWSRLVWRWSCVVRWVQLFIVNFSYRVGVSFINVVLLTTAAVGADTVSTHSTHAPNHCFWVGQPLLSVDHC